MRRFKKIYKALAILLLILSILLSGKLIDKFKLLKIERNNKETLEEVIKKKNEILNMGNGETQTGEPPESFYLEVPFICQAPLQTEENWKFHEESCEEAAVLQAYHYETGKNISKQQANEEILKMIDWEKKNFGRHKDLYAKDLKQFILKYYNLKDSEVQIIFDATLEDIKKQIAKNHPVIVPITGDILNNPFYPYPGYHMLVAIGYNKNKVITNDNGTKRGANYSYDQQTFKKAFEDAGADIIFFNLENKD